MAAAQQHGILQTADTVITNIMSDPESRFFTALELAPYSMRDIALANGLDRYTPGKSKIMWTEGERQSTSLTLTTAIAAEATTAFELSPIEAVVPNMVIAFQGTLAAAAVNEEVQVVSVDYTTGFAEVTRGLTGTTADTIADNSIGIVTGVAPAETDAAGEATAAFGAEYTNYLHYFEEVLWLTDFAEGLSPDTPEADLAYQITEKFSKMGAQLANALWSSQATGATAAARKMNGFRAQFATNVYPAIGALLHADIDTAVQACIANGGRPNTIFVPLAIKGGMGQWSGSRLASAMQVPGEAGGSIDVFRPSVGDPLEIVLDVAMRPTEMCIVDRNNLRAGLIPILSNQYATVLPNAPAKTGVRVELMARTGPQSKIQCLSYASSQLSYEYTGALLTGVSSVDPDGV